MGNNPGHYYNTIHKHTNKWFVPFSSKRNEILKMEQMIRTHLSNCVKQFDLELDENVKIILYLDDFYQLIKSGYYKSFIQIYERKLYGLVNPNASENEVKSDRKIPQYLFNIINDEVVGTIEKYTHYKEMAIKNFGEICRLANEINAQLEDIHSINGEELYVASQYLLEMSNTKRKLVNELTQNGIVIITESDLEDELIKYNKIISKCLKILQRTRHSFSIAKGSYVDILSPENMEKYGVKYYDDGESYDGNVYYNCEEVSLSNSYNKIDIIPTAPAMPIILAMPTILSYDQELTTNDNFLYQE